MSVGPAEGDVEGRLGQSMSVSGRGSGVDGTSDVAESMGDIWTGTKKRTGSRRRERIDGNARRMVLTFSLARPPGGCRDWTGQLSIRCQEAAQGWSHVRILCIRIEALLIALFLLFHLDSFMFSHSIRIRFTDSSHLSSETLAFLPLTASSSLPSSTPEPVQGSSTPPSVSVDTLVPVNVEVPLRPVCPPKFSGSAECEFSGVC